LGDVATTPNEAATAQGSAGTPVENPLLNSPSDDAARDALDVLSGSSLASTKGALIYDSRYTRELAIDRLRDVFCTVGHASDAQSGDAQGVGDCLPNRGRYAVWGQTFGGWGHTSGDGNADGLDRSTIGFVTGIDMPVADHWRAGVLAGYSHGHFNVDAQDARSDSDNYHLGVYGGAQWDKLVLRLGAGYTWHDITSDRSLMLGGTSNSLKADYDGATAQTFGELGYQLQAGRFGFEPFVNVAYVNLHTDSFTEDGGAAALSSRSGNTETTFSTLGTRMATDVNIGQAPATLRGMVGWRHAYGDITPKSRVSFAGGSAFTVSGVPIAEDAVVLGAGVDLHLTKRATFGLAFEGQYGDSTSDNTVRGTLTVLF
jgi:outer membrane autotransporter protein